MGKKLCFLLVSILLFLIGNIVNAQEQPVNQHITRGAFDLIKKPFWVRLPAMKNCVGDLATVSLPNNIFFQKLKFNSHNRIPNYIGANYLLLDKKNNSDPKTTEKPMKISKICKQFLIGELFGIGGIFISPVFISPFVPKDAWSALSYGYISSLIGYCIGNSIGVYISGNDKYEKGSYFTTLGGSILGTLIGVSTFIFLDNKDIGAYLSILGPPIGSIIGFNLSRKPKESSGEALINYGHGSLKWSLGKINVHYDFYYQPVLNVNLLQANF